MNLASTIATEIDSGRDVAPEVRKGGTFRDAGFIERWLDHNLNAIALAITAAAFVLRIVAARKTYFNPDEALHYLLINEPSLLLAYKASLTNAHPPLVYFLLYLSHLAGRSDLVLRLPLVLAGTAFCWFTFKWIQALFGGAAGLIALITAAFSPVLIALSAEVREYALLLFCVVAALYFFEKALEDKSVRTMWVFSCFLYGAILSHYSAAFFALAMGLYALGRIGGSKCPRKLFATWAIGQVGALAIYIFLYVTHVSKIKHNLALWATPFGDAFFQFNQESIFHFTRKNTWNIFVYLFAERYVAIAMLIAFIASVAYLFLRDLLPASHRRGPEHLGIQIFVPFVALWAAGVGGIYPYIASRHTIILAPFVIAAAGFLLAAICRQKLWAGILVASLLAGVSNVYGNPSEPGIPKPNQNRALMTGAIDYVQESIPQGDLILSDLESSTILARYYCEPEQASFLNWAREKFDQFRCHGHVIVTLHFWRLTAEGLDAPFTKTVHDYGLKAGNRIWVFRAGWGGNLLAQLPLSLTSSDCVSPRAFGENIAIVPLVVGADFAPGASTKCRN